MQIAIARSLSLTRSTSSIHSNRWPNTHTQSNKEISLKQNIWMFKLLKAWILIWKVAQEIPASLSSKILIALPRHDDKLSQRTHRMLNPKRNILIIICILTKTTNSIESSMFSYQKKRQQIRKEFHFKLAIKINIFFRRVWCARLQQS